MVTTVMTETKVTTIMSSELHKMYINLKVNSECQSGNNVFINCGHCITDLDGGGTVVKVLCYKLEGRWFDPRWCHWNFSLT